jgi:hypothetical protein
MITDEAAAVLSVRLSVLMAVVVAALAVMFARYRRRCREERLAMQWEWAIGQCRDGVDIAYVRRVYQHAQRGSKAELVWHATGQMQDSWFRGWHPPAGVYVVLSGDVGWGPHQGSGKVGA